MKNRLIVLIPAAGENKGFRSETPAVLHGLLGKSLLHSILETIRELRPDRVVVAVRRRDDPVAVAAAAAGAGIVEPKSGTGPAGAVRAARTELAAERPGDLLVMPADLPLVRTGALKALLARHRKRGNACTVFSAVTAEPTGTGRIVRTKSGGFGIERESAAGPGGRIAREVAAGIYLFQTDILLRVVSRTAKRGSADDGDLAAAAAACVSAGLRAEAVPTLEPEDVLRIRTRYDLGRAADLLRIRKIRSLAEAGVTILSPATTWIDRDATIGPETVVYPGVVIEGPTVIGRNGRIHPGAHIINSVIGDGVHILGLSVIEDTAVENDVRIGPFARIRMKTRLRAGSRAGNFVEMKNTDFGPKSKAMHLSYLGDTEVGEAANIGAGTITCNFDGMNKNRTWIGAGAFIGSGSELIAPVRIGRGAYIAAGSVITKDVSDDALAVARGRQVEKPGWAASRRKKLGLGGESGPARPK